jgi:hypothetical protein
MARYAEHASPPIFIFLPLPIGYIDLCAITLWQTDRTLLCGSLRHLIPAGMYGSQIWGTGFLQAGREFSSSLTANASFAFSEGHVKCEAVYH